MRERVRETSFGWPQAYVGADGTLVYLPETGASGLTTLVWIDRDGNESPTNVEPRYYAGPRLSPDGSQVVVAARDVDGYDIWIHDFIRGFARRITYEPGMEWFPVWTPDGRRIVYNDITGEQALMVTSADGTGTAEVLSSAAGRSLFPSTWTASGDRLLLSDYRPEDTGYDISFIDLDERVQPPEYLVRSPHAEGNPTLSPDGRWVAYSSGESGQGEVYASPFPEIGSAPRVQVSTSGGQQPVWSPRGGELFYRRGLDCDRPAPPSPDPNDQTQQLRFAGCTRIAVMAVPVESGPTLDVGEPQLLFETGPQFGAGRQFDVDAQGERFLLVKELASSLREVVVVRGWTQEVLERVPVN